MSTPRAQAPRIAWLAVGGAAASAAGWAGLPAIAPLVGGLVATAGALVLDRGRGGPIRTRGMAFGLGATLLGIRLLVGPAGSPPPGLPEEAGGPWVATVESMGSPRDGAQVARLRLALETGEVLVAATLPAFPAVSAGTVIEVGGRLRPPPDDDPYGEYLRRTGASGSLDARSITVMEDAPTGTLQAFREGAGDALRIALPEPEAGLAAGILIGLRERVDRQLAADFATAGASHVVAISGWNIAIVASLVAAAMRGRPRRLVAVAVGATILAYVVAAGASPSVVRAAVMASVVLVARESGRAGRAPAALAWAVVILLLADPRMIGDAGFRLSVLATAGLLAWATPLGARIGRLAGGRMPGWLAEGLGISLAAQAATLPDVLATFGRLSLVAPAVNLGVVPLVPLAMASGVAAMIGGWVVMLGAPPIVGTLIGLPGWLVLHVIVAMVRAGAAVPFAAVVLPPELAWPAGGAAAAAIAAVLLVRRRLAARPRPRPRRPATPAETRRPARPPVRGMAAPQRALVVGLALLVGIASAAVANAAGRETRLTVLDVGQGDAILIESRTGARMLVDGGPDPERLLLELDARIPPWDRRLDVIVLTHPHEDHVAGLPRVLARYAVGRVYEPGMKGTGPGWDAWDAALRSGPPRALLTTGARIRMGEITLAVLWPDAGSVPAEPGDTGTEINDVSIVLLGEANGRRFLLTGDAEEGVDPHLIAEGLPRLDVLKVAHHGSATATTRALLDVLRPAIALVSVGAGNTYGHPAGSTLQRLRDAGTRIVRTDQDGSIEVGLRTEGVSVRASGSRRTATIGDRAASGTAARTFPLGYDPSHDRPDAPRGRPPVALARAARVVPAARVRRGGRGRVAGSPRGGQRANPGRTAGCGRGPAARRGQAARGRGARPPPAWRGVGRMARRAWLAGARARGPGPPDHAPGRARV